LLFLIGLKKKKMFWILYNFLFSSSITNIAVSIELKDQRTFITGGPGYLYNLLKYSFTKNSYCFAISGSILEILTVLEFSSFQRYQEHSYIVRNKKSATVYSFLYIYKLFTIIRKHVRPLCKKPIDRLFMKKNSIKTLHWVENVLYI
jgi:hypothetical protein